MRFDLRDDDGGLLIVEADGELNELPSGAFLSDIQQLRDQGLRRIIIDCAKIDYLSTPGICALVQVHHWMRTRGGEMKMCCLQPLIVDLFRTTRLDRLFDVFPTCAAALHSFGFPLKSA